MYVTVYKDIVFVEGHHPDAKILEPISVQIRGAFVNTQLKSINHVKDKLVSKSVYSNANAIIQFKYGQKSRFLGSLFNRDDMVWYGEGYLAILPDHVYNQYLDARK